MTATVTEQGLVAQTVLDYFERWFNGDVVRMERALHPGLAKRSLEADGVGRWTRRPPGGWSTRRAEART